MNPAVVVLGLFESLFLSISLLVLVFEAADSLHESLQWMIHLADLNV